MRGAPALQRTPATVARISRPIEDGWVILDKAHVQAVWAAAERVEEKAQAVAHVFVSVISVSMRREVSEGAVANRAR